MIGVDEVGRGAWAGPLLVVAVRLKSGKSLPKGLRDYKNLSKKKRDSLASKIIEVCDVGDGWVSSDVIDSLGLSVALKSACLLAVLKLDARNDESIILDGNVNYFKDTHYKKVSVKIRADDTEPIVSAASIVAKVARDKYMIDLSEIYPKFGFDKHVGYGTKLHRENLKKYGTTKIHRFSVKPIRDLIAL